MTMEYKKHKERKLEDLVSLPHFHGGLDEEFKERSCSLYPLPHTAWGSLSRKNGTYHAGPGLFHSCPGPVFGLMLCCCHLKNS